MSLDLPADAEQLSGAGIDLDEARLQLKRLAAPPPPPRLERPCTPDDGIRRIESERERDLEATWQEAARAGRYTKFVPASGAATRMFAAAAEALEGSPASRDELSRRQAAGDERAGELLEMLDRLAELPFFPQLVRVLDRSPAEVAQRARSDDYPVLLEAILAPQGLGYLERPKALVPFHRYADGSRTAFEEQLVEGAGYLQDATGICRFHFTVPSDRVPLFEARAARLRSRAWRPEISLSVQRPSTDTLALEADRSPARHPDGRLLLRPGGHGALIHNLDALDADLVFVKNIDNVLPEPRQPLVVRWQRLLGGLLAETEARIHTTLLSLRGSPTSDDLAAAERLCRDELGWGEVGETADRREELLDRLARPLRVCGVVPNAGEPGGGPFWVRESDGRLTAQIVEAAQVALDDPEQAEVWRSSTHFNPVMLALALHRPEGGRYPLGDFVDPEAVLVGEKPYLDRRLRVLERPGLWNGAMAGWNTIFVEVPLATFAPVKTVVDLLRPEHQL